MTYEAAREALKDLNARIGALRAPKIDAGTEAHIAYRAKVSEFNNEGRAAGFIRIYDGSFKLNLKEFA